MHDIAIGKTNGRTSVTTEKNYSKLESGFSSNVQGIKSNGAINLSTANIEVIGTMGSAHICEIKVVIRSKSGVNASSMHKQFY